MAIQKIENLNDAERQWVATELQNTRGILARYSPEDAQHPTTLEAVDRAFTAFCAQADRSDGATASSIINALGITFGQQLVEQLGLEWAAVTDEYGCELAVVGLRGTADFVVFPPNFVARRWERGEVDFFVESARKIAEEFARFRSEWERNAQ